MPELRPEVPGAGAGLMARPVDTIRGAQVLKVVANHDAYEIRFEMADRTVVLDGEAIEMLAPALLEDIERQHGAEAAALVKTGTDLVMTQLAYLKAVRARKN